MIPAGCSRIEAECRAPGSFKSVPYSMFDVGRSMLDVQFLDPAAGLFSPPSPLLNVIQADGDQIPHVGIVQRIIQDLPVAAGTDQ